AFRRRAIMRRLIPKVDQGPRHLRPGPSGLRMRVAVAITTGIRNPSEGPEVGLFDGKRFAGERHAWPVERRLLCVRKDLRDQMFLRRAVERLSPQNDAWSNFKPCAAHRE